MNCKKIKFELSLLILLLTFVNYAFAQVSVHGYYRKDGTYVKGYERTYPDGNPYNNYSYPGNYNPNTGKITPGNPDTYLRNYYGRNKELNYNFEQSEIELPKYHLPKSSIPKTNYQNYENGGSQYRYTIKQKISTVQSSLELVGYNPGPIDGIWGPKTENALKKFQEANGIYESGKVNDQTVSELISELKHIYKDAKQDLITSNRFRWLKGTWKGIGYQINNDASWKMAVSFSSEGYFVNYKSPDCSGIWKLQDINNKKLIFKEKITSGINKCVDNGYVVLSRFSKNRINFKYYLPNSMKLGAQAFLTKK